jgi:DNA-binding MarR family transcriptional regulator
MTPKEFIAFLAPALRKVRTTRQLAMLGALAESRETIDFAVVAACLKLSKPALSRGLDRLEAAGLIARVRQNRASLDGGRRLLVAITKDGRELLAKMGVS